VGQKAK